jgi:hypothetical protein
MSPRAPAFTTTGGRPSARSARELAVKAEAGACSRHFETGSRSSISGAVIRSPLNTCIAGPDGR